MANSLIENAYKYGYITDVQKKKAEDYKKEANVNDDTAIRETKIMTDNRLVELYSLIYGYPVEENIENIKYDLASEFKYTDLLKYGFIPVCDGEKIRIISSKPADLLLAEDVVSDKTGYKGAAISLISQSNLHNLLEQVLRANNDDADEVFDVEEINVRPDIYNVSETDISKVVNIVNRIFRTAVESKISDIHIEPQEDALHIRFREDGPLRLEKKYPISVAGQLINRIKTMASLDVNTSRIIQDGNSRLEIFGQVVDLRISVIPAVNGENVVIRILDRNKMAFDISMLGFSEENEAKFLKIIKRPQGIFLLTGPTGSGKSTSLYAAISALNTEDRCIITFEDPVEYRISGIVQVQINQAAGVTFPEALKSGLRQDIEIALVGEIRDAETAAIAFDAANTGHMVFSTLHTNSAASSILRLVKMGVEPYVVSRTLIGVINQRLAKRICPICKEEYYLEEDSPYRKIFGDNKKIKLYRGTGCSNCGGTGYKGRIAIQEFLIVNDEIGELLDKGANTHEIEQAAIRAGMKKIQDDGIEKALKGLTTLDEVHRTVFFDNI